MSERNRVYYCDYLRVLAIVCVVFMHTASAPLWAGVEKGRLNWIILNLFTSFSFCAIPLFFMLSGYFLLSNEKTLNITVLFRERLPRLIFPVITWTAVIAIRSLLRRGFTLTAFVSILLGAFNQPVADYFWFMYTLIPIYLISPVLYAGLHGLDKKGKRFIFVLIVLVFLQSIGRQLAPAVKDRFFNFSILNSIEFFDRYLCTFFLGYFLGSSRRTVPNWLLLTLGALCLAGISAGTYILTVSNGFYDQTLQLQNSGLEHLLASCIFLLFKQNLNRKIPVLYDLIRPVAALSFPIYMTHPLCLSLVSFFGIQITGFVDTVWIAALVFVLCVLVAMTATCIPPLCFPVTGLSVADARRSCRWHIRKTE